MMARGLPQDITRRRERGDKNDAVARVRIRRNARVTWEETLLPGNVTRLLNTGGRVYIHGRITEGSDRRLPRGDKIDTRNTCRIESFQHQGQQRARDTRQDTGSGVPSHRGTVTIHRDPMQEGRTDRNSFPNNDSEEAG